MANTEYTDQLETLFEGRALRTADHWADLATDLFASLEQAAAFRGHWAEFDAAMRVFQNRLEARIEVGKWVD